MSMSLSVTKEVLLVPKACPPWWVVLGNGTCLRSFASLGVAHDNHTKAVQLPGQVRSQVQLGNEEMNRAFSACSRSIQNPWGDAPG